MGGTSKDFTAYAAARWRTLVHAAMLLGCDLHEAEDLAQTTLMKTYASWSRVSRMEHRDAYVARIQLNTLRASRRRHWRHERPTQDLPESPGPDESARVDEVDAVVRALARLSVAHREVVVLRHYVQLSEADVAETLKIPPGTVKSRLSRALALLSTDPDLADLHGRTP